MDDGLFMTTNLITATEITINRAEGPSLLCTERRFTGPDCWADAERHLRTSSASAPGGRACDKCDVTITFADGFQYDGRYELREGDAFTTLASQVGQAWDFYARRNLNERQERVLDMLKINSEVWAIRRDTYALSGPE